MADDDDSPPSSSPRHPLPESGGGAPLAKVIPLAGRPRRARKKPVAGEAVNRQRSRGASEAAGDELDAGRTALDAEREQRELDERIALAEREIERGHREAVSERAILRSLRAIRRFRRGDHDGAFAEWNELVDEDPRQDDVLFMRASFHWFAGNLDAAVADLDRAAELWPARAQIYERRGKVLMELEDYDRANANFLRLIQLTPRDPSAYLCLAKSQRFGGDPGAAIRACGRAIKLDPWRADPYELRASCYLAQRSRDEARKDLDRCLELDPKRASALRTRAELYTSPDKDSLELADLSRALELEPNHTRALQRRAFCHERRGELELAIADYTRAIELKPGEAAFWSGRGEAYLKLGAHESAMTDLTQAIVLCDGYDAEAYWLRGHARRKRGDLQGAREDYIEALRLDESLYEEVKWRRCMNSRLGTTAEKMEYFDIALIVCPTDYTDLFERAKLHISLKAYDAALRDLDKAVELAGTWWDDLYHARAEVHCHLGAFEKAAEDESRALAMMPYVAEYHGFRGIYRALSAGPSREAAADILRALELAPEDKTMLFLRDWYRELAERPEEQVRADELADDDEEGPDEGASSGP